MATKYVVSLLVIVLLLISSLNSAYAFTNSGDVGALQNLYTSLNSAAQLTGWSSNGTDPCGDLWAGVQCSGPGVTEIHLSGLDLTGGLGYRLDQLKSLTILDLSGNRLSGALPYQLPPNLEQLNVGKNNLSASSGNLPYSISGMVHLTYLNVSDNQLTGTISDVFANLKNLTSLDLSFNNLTGALPQSFSSLSSLSTLHLQNNMLSGNLNLVANLSLKDLDVERNHFSGSIPSAFSSIPNLKIGYNNFSGSFAPHPSPSIASPLQNQNNGSLSGNSDNQTTLANTSFSSSGTKSVLNVGAIVGITIAGVLAIIVLATTLIYFFSKEREGSHDEEKRQSVVASVNTCTTSLTRVLKDKEDAKLKCSPPSFPLKPPPSNRYNLAIGRDFKMSSSGNRTRSTIIASAYTISDLQIATNGFSQENLVGEGSSGRVYKAELSNGKLVAVKSMDAASCCFEKEEDIMEIISSISRLHHANIAELVGYCTEHGQCMLVYEYFGKGTLYDVLHSTDDISRTGLTWNVRVKIALGTARALEYLHEVCLPSVIHKNFKAANVLLDEELNPYLSDSGIAAFAPNFERQCSTHMMGSFGYRAPEYVLSGTYTMKSDVYSFGVVMLELLTGRKALDSTKPRNEQSLVRWATPQLHDIDALSKMVDPALKGLYPVKSLSRFADVIALCVQPEPEFRPSMSEVVQSLVRLMQRANLNKRKSGDEQKNLGIQDTEDSSS